MMSSGKREREKKSGRAEEMHLSNLSTAVCGRSKPDLARRIMLASRVL